MKVLKKVMLSALVLVMVSAAPAQAGNSNRLFDSGPSGASSGESSRLLDSGHQLAMRLFGWLLG